MSRVAIRSGMTIANWNLEASGWIGSPLRAHEALSPALAEWASFWMTLPTGRTIDARDLSWDGRGRREIDWDYRARAWVEQRGRGLPSPAQTPSGYKVYAFEEGWVLHDTLLDRPVLMVAFKPPPNVPTVDRT